MQAWGDLDFYPERAPLALGCLEGARFLEHEAFLALYRFSSTRVEILVC